MRSRRYIVPAGITGLIAVATAVPHLSSASAATPDLPAVTAQQLLARVHQADPAGLSGTVELSSDLGLPDLSNLGVGDGQSMSSAGFDPTSLLTGTTTFHLWDAGATEQRLALAPSPTSEVDVVRLGDQVWTSDSDTQRVTHHVLPAHRGEASLSPSGTPPTPQQAAAGFLSSITPTTDVSVVTPVYVAGRPTYELRLAPKATDSSVSSVTLAVDAATGVPLRVEVTPVGSAVPAVTLGFTSVSFAVPAASEFTPLVGTSETTKTAGMGSGSDHRASDDRGHHRHGPRSMGGANPRAGHPSFSGTGWGTIVTLHTSALAPSDARKLDDASTAVTLPGGGSARLVTSRLLNAVVLPDGTVVAGFVNPSALEAAAAAPGG